MEFLKILDSETGVTIFRKSVETFKIKVLAFLGGSSLRGYTTFAPDKIGIPIFFTRLLNL
jgi:hypothetical protein